MGRIQSAVMERQHKQKKENTSNQNTPPMAKATIIKDGGDGAEGYSKVEGNDSDESREVVEEEHKGLIV